jgi:hypothetical protein
MLLFLLLLKESNFKKYSFFLTLCQFWIFFNLDNLHHCRFMSESAICVSTSFQLKKVCYLCERLGALSICRCVKMRLDKCLCLHPTRLCVCRDERSKKFAPAARSKRRLHRCLCHWAGGCIAKRPIPIMRTANWPLDGLVVFAIERRTLGRSPEQRALGRGQQVPFFVLSESDLPGGTPATQKHPNTRVKKSDCAPRAAAVVSGVHFRVHI